MIEEHEDCHACGENRATVFCRGCKKPLCNQCIRLEDYGFGCDGCKIVAFCEQCFRDPDVNTVLRYEEY